MRVHLCLSIASLTTLAMAQGKCRFGNGTLLPDVPEWNIYQPCAGADGPTTICCATARDNPPWGNISLGFTQDECLPNGLTARITPCDGTATSSRWCCGDTRGCCDSNSGVVLLEQVLGQVSSSVISSSSSRTLSSAPTPTSSQVAISGPPTETSSASSDSSGLGGGAIAGIVVGAIAGLALVVAGALFFARRASRKRKLVEEAPAVAEVPYSPVSLQEMGPTVKYAHVQEMPGAPPGELQGDVPAQAHRP
ncbi:hypothetical protein OPT61_g3204 [Boeremia exigua]|uniref:Uncharacterized protein n=1 Tax=Boeremia exigua TaxID=749465 RepID=A0ACC2IIS2_9PLEO|nr:hypothetical protein OPT61_g3204 [Boeremia exigua]